MSRKPEIVVTGVHVPGVHLWARVLVRPDRLQQVKHSILVMGRADLQPGEILEIDTDPGEGPEQAVTVGDPGAERPWGPGIIAWNEFRADVTIYADDVDHLAAISEPVVTALFGRAPRELLTKAVWLHSDRIDSIHVGGVHVHFERAEDTKEGIDQEAPKAKGKRAYGYVADPDLKVPLNVDLVAGADMPLPPGTTIVSEEVEADADFSKANAFKVAEAHHRMLKATRDLARLGIRVRTGA